MRDNRRLVTWIAILSVSTLVAHAVDAPDHLSEWWGYGSVFVVVAAFQFFYGIAVFLQPWKYDEEGNVRANPDQGGRPYFILGTILSALVILVYIVSRTTGMPFFGPDAVVERVTLLSLVPPLECLPLLYLQFLLLSRIRVSSGKPSQAA